MILPTCCAPDSTGQSDRHAGTVSVEAETAQATPEVSSPVKTASTKTTKATKAPVQPRPQVEMYPDITFEPDGTPLCPGGCRMRHALYSTAKSAHIFACPATRINGAGEWIFHADECPHHERCTPPEKKMGLTYYIKSEADLRLFPPIPGDPTRFKALYAQRTGIERQNSVADSYKVDRCHRNATFVLIRLTFVNICKHARLRDAERHATGGKKARLHAALQQLDLSTLLPN